MNRPDAFCRTQRGCLALDLTAISNELWHAFHYLAVSLSFFAYYGS